MKKILLIAILAVLANPVFPALEKVRVMDGHEYKHHVLIRAEYDRTKGTVIAHYALYKDAAYYASNPRGFRRVYSVVIPFSAIPLENLNNVKTITEASTKRSVIENEQETNWWFDSTVVSD